jgi:hypothetical protein
MLAAPRVDLVTARVLTLPIAPSPLFPEYSPCLPFHLVRYEEQKRWAKVLSFIGLFLGQSRPIIGGLVNLLMTHKYRGSQQSSREVLPKFIDSTQGEPKNICKP